MEPRYPTHTKSNGDLNLDIENLLERVPQLRGSACDDELQKTFSVALVPYLAQDISDLEEGIGNLVGRIDAIDTSKYKETVKLISEAKADNLKLSLELVNAVDKLSKTQTKMVEEFKDETLRIEREFVARTVLLGLLQIVVIVIFLIFANTQ